MLWGPTLAHWSTITAFFSHVYVCTKLLVIPEQVQAVAARKCVLNWLIGTFNSSWIKFFSFKRKTVLFILPYNYYFLTKWAYLTSTEVFYMVLPFSSLQDISCCVPCAVSLAFKVCVMLMHHFSQHFFFLHFNNHNTRIRFAFWTISPL